MCYTLAANLCLSDLFMISFWFNSTPTQFRSYCANTGTWFWLISGVTNLKQHQGSKPPHLLEFRDASTPVIWNHLIVFYNCAVINSGCNSDASALQDNGSATRGMIFSTKILKSKIKMTKYNRGQVYFTKFDYESVYIIHIMHILSKLDLDKIVLCMTTINKLF
jgi:hypothetical protein